MLELIRRADDSLDTYKLGLSEKYFGGRPVALMPYRTYGEPNRIYLKGRVLADKGITQAKASDDLINNLLNMYRRFETDERPGMKIRMKLGEEVFETASDKEGYYHFEVNPSTPVVSGKLYFEIPVELLNRDGKVIDEEQAQIMIPPADAEYGVISDIDDTVITSNVTNLYKMAKTMLVNNARSRLPFPGVSAFYKALQLGRNGERNNPFFM